MPEIIFGLLEREFMLRDSGAKFLTWLFLLVFATSLALFAFQKGLIFYSPEGINYLSIMRTCPLKIIDTVIESQRIVLSN